MRIVEAPKLWQFDVDDTLILWDKSQHPETECITVTGPKGHEALVVPNRKNVNLLVKLSKVGWYIRVHSGSGPLWAAAVVRALDIEEFVDEAAAKPLGNTDDKGPGDGIAYNAYRDPKTGKEA